MEGDGQASASETNEPPSLQLDSVEKSSKTGRTKQETKIIRDERVGITPIRVTIPRIDVEAEIENVGLLPNGQMEEPDTMDGVAWYELGKKPGDQGSAVLAGHVDSKTGPAIFYDLNKLEKGDEIIVTGEEGEPLTFIVQDKVAYPREEAPVQKIFGYSFRRQLNLITCTGEFNRDAGTHDERLVVYTVLKSDLL